MDVDDIPEYQFAMLVGVKKITFKFDIFNNEFTIIMAMFHTLDTVNNTHTNCVADRRCGGQGSDVR